MQKFTDNSLKARLKGQNDPSTSSRKFPTTTMKSTGWRGGKQFLLFILQIKGLALIQIQMYFSLTVLIAQLSPPDLTLWEIYLETEVSLVWMSNLYKNEYYHTVVIATKKLSNSEAKPRCYDNFEGDKNHVVIFLIDTCCDQFKNTFYWFFIFIFADNYIFKG